MFRVVKGVPTAEELAVLVAVLAARRASGAGAATPAVRRSGWSARAGGLRRYHRHGPDGWRAAALPR
ncbi:MAG: acyl-CoA carboxylase subunit epsilon [Propionibacteriales bacterium]|nr:acyl-CoA carboxylase subunit epsilon [Propionibacteriales bacterium]